MARSYGEDVASVVISTGGSAGNDLDLAILECITVDGNESCEAIGQSAGATDVERVEFTPVAGKTYKALVVGYGVTANDGVYTFSETRKLVMTEPGTIVAESAGDSSWLVQYDFDVAGSTLLASPLFTSGKYGVVGSLTMKTADGSTMISLPVAVRAPVVAH